MSSGQRRGRPPRWTPERIERVLRELHAGRATFLSTNALRAMGRRDLLAAMERSGGVDSWARRLGLPRPTGGPSDVYSWDRARADAQAAIERFGLLPGSDGLRGAGLGRLASFIEYRCGNRRRFLAELGFTGKELDRLTGKAGNARG